jgi:hypothetical protein
MFDVGITEIRQWLDFLPHRSIQGTPYLPGKALLHQPEHSALSAASVSDDFKKKKGKKQTPVLPHSPNPAFK